MSKTRYLSLAALVLLAAYAVYLVVRVAASPDIFQWDFKTYYYAAAAAKVGIDPYDPAALHEMAGGNQMLRYVYPPMTLAFFRVFTLVPCDTACQVWLALKLLLLAAMVVLWKRHFFSTEATLPFALFLLLGYGATIYVDLVTGNISIIEQFFLWLGLIFLLRKRPLLFAASVVLASCFKLTPIAFLLLLPLAGGARPWRHLAAAGGVFVAYLLSGCLLDPLGFGKFVSASTGIEENARLGNPSLLAFCRDLAAGLGASWGTSIPSFLPYVVFVVMAAAVIYFTARRMLIVRRQSGDNSALWLLFLFCAAFSLIVPRLKTYSFILLLPPAFYTLRRSARTPAYLFLFVLTAITTTTPLPVKMWMDLFWQYYPLLLALLVWVLLLRLEPDAASA